MATSETGEGLGLILDPAMGMAGDMFSSALIALGVPAPVMTAAMARAARPLGGARLRAETVGTKEGSAVRLRVELDARDPHLGAGDARALLDAAVRAEGLGRPYADFAWRALEILIIAEREAHSGGQLDADALSLRPIGFVRTPYSDTAPSQPPRGEAGRFHVELFPEFAAGIEGLGAFSHVYVVSYLRRSPGYSLTVTPPWQVGEAPRTVGVFASRSPNRPSPLGLTLVRVLGIVGNRIHTSPMDLFDRTPVVDLKPHLASLDETGLGNDGWLADSDHLQLHKEGVPHRHAGEEAVLHEARDILLDVVGAAKGLEFLGVSPEDVVCLTPVSVGGGRVRCSHGDLPVPTPAASAILRRFRVPHVAGPVDVELLTPTGAALLTALRPRWRPREMGSTGEIARRGLGLGTRELDPVNALRVALERRSVPGATR